MERDRKKTYKKIFQKYFGKSKMDKKNVQNRIGPS